MPEPYKHLNRITPLIEQVQNVNHQLVEQHRQHALERIDARIEESRQRLLEAHATSELQNSVLLPMQKARKRAEVSQSIPEILAEQQETKALQMDADKKINLWIDELCKSKKHNSGQQMKLNALPTQNRLMLWWKNPLSNRYRKNASGECRQ